MKRGSDFAGGRACSIQIYIGRFAMIDNSPGFSLAPSNDDLEQWIGHPIPEETMPGGGVD